MCSAFVNTLGAGNNIPYLALPFNLIAVCTFLTIQPHLGGVSEAALAEASSENEGMMNETFNATSSLAGSVSYKGTI